MTGGEAATEGAGSSSRVGDEKSELGDGTELLAGGDDVTELGGETELLAEGASPEPVRTALEKCEE